MRILLLGANGRTGREIMKRASMSDAEVTAVVRSADRMPEEFSGHVRVRVADACREEALRPLMAGMDMVISVLGPRWPTRSATRVYSESARAIVGAMEASACRRLLVTSSALLFPLQRRTDRLLARLVPRVVEHAREMERTITNSDLQWTIARTSFLTNEETSAARVLNEPEVLREAPRGAVARRAVARFLLEEGPERPGQIVGLFGPLASSDDQSSTTSKAHSLQGGAG